jgi:hypothetical protein
MYFSRRKLRHPAPPFPASTTTLAESTNFIIFENNKKNSRYDHSNETFKEK